MPKHRIDFPETRSPLDESKLQQSLAGEMRVMKLNRGDWHTRGVVRLMRQRFAEWNAAPPVSESVGLPTEVGPLEKEEVLPGLSVPIYDEDWGPVGLSKRALHHVLRSLPVVDYADTWPSHEEAVSVVRTEFGPITPLASVEWLDMTSDRAIELLAFHGMGSHRVAPLALDHDGARYVVDLSWMGGFPVREGLEPYGAAAFFSHSGELLRIYTAVDDRVHYPGSSGWEDAKWRWKCSLMVGITVADHLGQVHLVFSNFMVTATREHLPPDHPIRRLLKPYEFRSVAINYDAALALAPKGGLAHRAFGFTYDGLVQCLLHATRTARFITFPKALCEMQVDHLGDRFPFATDGLALWRTMREFVAEYAAVFFDAGELTDDPAIRAWWRGLCALAPSMGILPLSQDEQVIELLTQFLFVATGYHEHVGGLAEYLLDPTFMAGKIRSGERIADVQATAQVLVLLAATGLKQPPLIGDYSHLLLDRGRADTEAILSRYQAALKTLSCEIDERNRGRAQAYQTFNPIILQSSVSI